MTIWGHEYVYVEKDAVKREWRVFVSKDGALLCTVPWADAFKDFSKTQARDYAEAVETCMSHPDTRLTDVEAEAVKRGDVPQTDGQVNVVLVDFSRGRRR